MQGRADHGKSLSFPVNPSGIWRKGEKMLDINNSRYHSFPCSCLGTQSANARLQCRHSKPNSQAEHGNRRKPRQASIPSPKRKSRRDLKGNRHARPHRNRDRAPVDHDKNENRHGKRTYCRTGNPCRIDVKKTGHYAELHQTYFRHQTRQYIETVCLSHKFLQGDTVKKRFARIGII